MKVILIASLFLLGLNVSCGNKGGDNNNGGGGPGGDCSMGGCGPMPSSLSIDLSNAVGLAVTDGANSTGGSSLFLADSGAGIDSNLIVITSDDSTKSGAKEAIPEGYTDSDFPSNNFGGKQQIPNIVAMGFSPIGDVYVLFEHRFFYRKLDDPKDDPWDQGSTYQCQLFKSKLTVSEAQNVDVADMDTTNLECVSNQHEIPTWDRSSRLMQFSSDGTMYFPARIPGSNGKEVFYAYDPSTGDLTEKVNANICFRDIEVTPRGSIFYTGQSSNGSNCNGNSYFRYISTANSLVEIARDWWEFRYDSYVDPANPDTEKILFYGPDPSTSSGLPSWDTACLYEFDPTLPAGDRAKKIAHCLNNIWNWIEARDITGYNLELPSLEVRKAKKERCEADGQVFIGGSNISQLEQNTAGDIYINGDLRKKIGGEFKCDVEIASAHCSSLDPAHATSADCIAAGYSWTPETGWCDGYGTDDAATCASNSGTWRKNSQWYNAVETDACLATSTAGDVDEPNGIYLLPDWKVRWVRCDQPSTTTSSGDGWTSTIKGLAIVDQASTTDDEKLLKLLSEEDEQVIRFWHVKIGATDQVFYASFKDGQYLLRQPVVNEDGSVTHTTLLTDYEIYNLSSDPNNANNLLFDGLKFTTNAYRFGSLNPAAEDPEGSVVDKEGLTGQIKMLIILPTQ